jgi:hypothetical protein
MQEISARQALTAGAGRSEVNGRSPVIASEAKPFIFRATQDVLRMKPNLPCSPFHCRVRQDGLLRSARNDACCGEATLFHRRWPNLKKVFWFFFSKKNSFLPFC